jgi:hypothetical protein
MCMFMDMEVNKAIASQLLFYWWIFVKFQPEKHDFNLCKGFFMEKIGVTSANLEWFFSKLSNSYDKFHEVAKNIEGYFLKELSYLLLGQILFDFF